jgi:hypothetical protein
MTKLFLQNKTIKNMNKLLGVLLLFTAFFAACCKIKDDNSSFNTYPKQVSVTYRVNSLSTTTLNSLRYSNETGGTNQAKDFALPFSKTIFMTVNDGDGLYLSYSDPNGPNVKLEILVNNKVVKAKNFTGNSGAIDYYFQ